MKILTGTQTLLKSRKREKAPELVAEQEEADREKSDVSNESSDGSDDSGTESSGEEEEDLMIAALEELAEEEAESEGCIGRAETEADEADEQAKVDHRQTENMIDLLEDASDINRISVCEALEQRFKEAQREPSMPSAEPSSQPSAKPGSLPSAEPRSLPTDATAEATEELHVDDAFRAQNHSVRTRTNTTPNPWFKISDVEWGTALAEDVNWEFQWGTALEQRIEKYLQYDSEATATECTEQRTYYSSLIMQNCTTGASRQRSCGVSAFAFSAVVAGEQWHIHATDPRIKTNRAATQSFVYFELDGTDACIGGVRELYSDGAGAPLLLLNALLTIVVCSSGRPCFVHDRYLILRDLQIIGNASVTSGRELPWDTDSELAWCPMLTNTYVRNLQGLCSMLPRLETGANQCPRCLLSLLLGRSHWVL